MPFQRASAGAETQRKREPMHMSGHRSQAAQLEEVQPLPGGAAPAAAPTGFPAPPAAPLPPPGAAWAPAMPAAPAAVGAAPPGAAPLSAAPGPASRPAAPGPAPLPAAPPTTGSISDKELLTREKLLQRAAFQGDVVNLREMQPLLTWLDSYQQAVNSNPIPAANTPNFPKAMGIVNARIMSAHERLIAVLAQTAQALPQTAQALPPRIPVSPHLPRMFTKENPAVAVLNRLASECGNLAVLVKSQTIYLNKIYDDMIAAHRRDPDSLQGVAGKTYTEILRDVEMYHFSSSGSARALGAGAINTVYRDTFQGRDRVFKRGKAYEHSQPDAGGMEANVAIDVMQQRMKYKPEELRYGNTVVGWAIKNAHTAQRDVAYSRLNELFGFNVSVSTQLAQSEEGETSSLMDMAQGDTADQFLFYTGTEWAETARTWAHQTYSEKSSKARKTIEDMRRAIADMAAQVAAGTLKADTYEKRKKDAEEMIRESEGYLRRHERRGTLQTVDLTDPAFAMQLFKMTVLDLVAGHVDRHFGNFMINQSEGGETRLTAIDNDTSFSERTDVESTSQMRGGELRPALEEAFPFVPMEIAYRILELKPEDVAQALTGLLSEGQIRAACIRFEKLREWVKKLAADREHKGIRELTRQNIGELFNRDRGANYFAGLYHGQELRATSPTLQDQDWFRQKPPKPLPVPPGAQR